MKADEISKAEEKETSGSALESSQGEDTTAPSGPPTATVNPEKSGNAVSPEKPPDEQRPESPKPAAAVVPSSAPNSGELLLPLFFSVVDVHITGLHTQNAYTNSATSSSQCVHEICSCIYSFCQIPLFSAHACMHFA